MEPQPEIKRVSNAKPEPFVDQTLDVLSFQTFGFVVLHHFFDPALIASERPPFSLRTTRSRGSRREM